MDCGQGVRHIARDALAADQRNTSSTLRELIGDAAGLEATLNGELQDQGSVPVRTLMASRNLQARIRTVGDSIRGQHVVGYSDSQVMCTALEKGTSNMPMQAECRKIWDIAMKYSLIMHFRWLPRDSAVLQFHDDGSKMLEECDYALNMQDYHAIEAEFDVSHTIDRFATHVNRRCSAFNSRWYSAGMTGTPDTFTQDWGAPHDNWLHPPHSLVGQTVDHLRFCRGVGTILVPWDHYRTFWPLVAPYARGWVKGKNGFPMRKELHRRHGLLLRQATVPLRKGPHHLLAIRLDFSKDDGGSVVRSGLAKRLSVARFTENCVGA
jgi:hypothetical protein